MLINLEFAALQKIVEEYIKQAKEQGDQFNKRFEDSNVYIKLQSSFKLLQEMNLLNTHFMDMDKLTKQAKKWNDLIKEAK